MNHLWWLASPAEPNLNSTPAGERRCAMRPLGPLGPFRPFRVPWKRKSTVNPASGWEGDTNPGARHFSTAFNGVGPRAGWPAS
jgi:hypothetical protein